jgi:DNA-binding response OmpR family regulator
MPKVVIIEDDALMRSLMAEWLKAEGYRVDEVAIDELNTIAAAAVVIVDVYMPRKLGAQRLRAARKAYPDVPTIAVSTQFCPGVECSGPAAQALGVDCVIAKPFGREALLNAVRSVIGRRASMTA